MISLKIIAKTSPGKTLTGHDFLIVALDDDGNELGPVKAHSLVVHVVPERAWATLQVPLQSVEIEGVKAGTAE